MKGGVFAMNEGTENAYQDFFKDYHDVVSINDVSQMINVCKVKAYNLVKTGQIPGVKIGHVYRIPKKSIYDFFNTEK